MTLDFSERYDTAVKNYRTSKSEDLHILMGFDSKIGFESYFMDFQEKYVAFQNENQNSAEDMTILLKAYGGDYQLYTKTTPWDCQNIVGRYQLLSLAAASGNVFTAFALMAAGMDAFDECMDKIQ